MTYWPITYYIYEGTPGNVTQLTDANQYKKIHIQGSSLFVMRTHPTPQVLAASHAHRLKKRKILRIGFNITVLELPWPVLVLVVPLLSRVTDTSWFCSLNTGFIGSYTSATIQTGTIRALDKLMALLTRQHCDWVCVHFQG